MTTNQLVQIVYFDVKNMLLKSCYDLALLAPNKGVIGLPKDVLYVLAAQRAAKL